MTNGEKFKEVFKTVAEINIDWWNAEYKEPTTKNDKVDCEHTDCNNCVNHKYCDYEKFDAVMDNMLKHPSTTKNNLVVDCISRTRAIERLKLNFPISQGADNSRDRHRYMQAQADLQAIRELPPVTPQLSSGTRKNSEKLEKDFGESDCISRQAINGYIDYILSHGMGKKKSFDFIKKFVSNLSSITPQASTTKNDLGVDKEQLKTMIRGLTKWYVKRDNTEVGEPNTAVGLLYDDVMFGIDRLPSVTSIRPKGHWKEEFNDLEGEVRFTCSSCGKYQLFGTDFCYHCGSDNREVVEDGND